LVSLESYLHFLIALVILCSAKEQSVFSPYSSQVWSTTHLLATNTITQGPSVNSIIKVINKFLVYMELISIILFTQTCQWILSWNSSCQFTPHYYTSVSTVKLTPRLIKNHAIRTYRVLN